MTFASLSPNTGYVPSDLHLGGTRVSPSYLARYHECPMKWYWSYLHPTPGLEFEGQPAAGVGLAGGKPSKAMLLGSLIHAGLEYYYLSMDEDGNPNLHAAVGYIQLAAGARAREFPDPKVAEDLVADATNILDNYNRFYGPGGRTPDWPLVRPLVDEQGPIIERSFEMPLPNCGAHLSVRPDGMFSAHGWTVAMEHKSSGSRNVGKVLAKLTMDGQAMAEMAVSAHHFPNPRPTGVYANILVTDRRPTAGMPMFERQIVHYTPGQVGDYLAMVDATVCDIKRAVENWRNLVDKGSDPVHAARTVFALRGVMTGQCIGYWGRCEYHLICSAPGHEASSLLSFRPKGLQVEAPAGGGGDEG